MNVCTGKGVFSSTCCVCMLSSGVSYTLTPVCGVYPLVAYPLWFQQPQSGITYTHDTCPTFLFSFVLIDSSVGYSVVTRLTVSRNKIVELLNCYFETITITSNVA